MGANAQQFKMLDEFIGLFETMRQAQLQRDKLLHDRDGHASAHQVRRAEQAAKVAEQRCDEWSAAYRAEMKKLASWVDACETNELPGLYDVERER